MRRLMVALTLLCAVLAPGIGAAHAGPVGIYWGDFSNSKVQHADLDGSNVTDLVTNVKPSGVDADAAGGKVINASLGP